MQVLFITIGFLILAVKAAPLVTAMILAATLIVTYAGQITVKLVTGVESSGMEVFRAVGLGVLFVLLLVLWQASFNWHFAGRQSLNLSAGCALAYVTGFMVVMRLHLLQACIVAAVTTATSVGLFFVITALGLQGDLARI